jgi:23S rRNA maturation-related 3'-5' exoribonuclease YhaM
MTVLQRVFNAFHGLVSLLNKEDEDRPDYTDEYLGDVACGAVEGDLRNFVAEVNQAREEKRVA